jgi:hypothetical protein
MRGKYVICGWLWGAINSSLIWSAVVFKDTFMFPILLGLGIVASILSISFVILWFVELKV